MGGATREITYKAYFLVGYDTESELELMCSGDFSHTVKTISTLNDPSKTEKLLEYISSSRCTISFSEFESLLPLVIPSTTTPSSDEIANIATLFSAVAVKDRDLLNKEIFHFLDWFASARECQEVGAILETFFALPTSSASIIILKADMAAYLATKLNCESMTDMLSLVISSYPVMESTAPANGHTLHLFGRYKVF